MVSEEYFASVQVNDLLRRVAGLIEALDREDSEGLLLFNVSVV